MLLPASNRRTTAVEAGVAAVTKAALQVAYAGQCIAAAAVCITYTTQM
jgi:hypothetical protein